MSSNSYPPVTLPGTEVRLLHSATINQEYKLFVALPQGYEATEDRYPVLYFSDANWFFSAVSMLGMLGIPPMIMVGIGYPTDDFVDIFRLQARDFTPTQSPTDEATVQQIFQVPIESGGGDKFLAFIRDELFTFIDAEYRTDPTDRTFFGYSYGGTFGLYTLFEQPDTFQRYLIGAPTLVYDQGICFQYEENYAASQNDLSAKLYLCVGEFDEDLLEHNASKLYRFQAVLKSRNYAGLDLTFEVFNDETHQSSIAIAVSRGIRAVYDCL